MPTRLLIILCLGFILTAQISSAQPAESPQCHALLIGGMGGYEPYIHWYADWVTRFQTYLTKNAGVPAANITVLTGDAATLDAINAALDKIGKTSKPQDQFILFIVGHGEASPNMPTLTLRGPDLGAKQLADALNALPAKNQIVLNFCASSGSFIKALAAPNRVNITATSPTEVDEPIFAELFLRGLESKRADIDKSGSITMLKAYNWAAQQTILWIARWSQTGPGKQDPMNPQPTVWKASGKETIEIFEKLYSGVPMRKLDPTSDRKSEDAPVEVQPADGQITDAWQKRRVIDEHAMLEDCGQEIGVSVLGEKGLQPIVGQNPKDPGYLAARTILGQPTPLNP